MMTKSLPRVFVMLRECINISRWRTNFGTPLANSNVTLPLMCDGLNNKHGRQESRLYKVNVHIPLKTLKREILNSEMELNLF